MKHMAKNTERIRNFLPQLIAFLENIGEIAAIAAELKTALKRKNLNRSAFIQNQRKIVE